MTVKYISLPRPPQRWHKKAVPIKYNIKNYRGLIKQFILPLTAFMLLVLIVIPIATYLFFVRDLATKESIMNRNDTGVTLMDRNGNEFFNFYEARPKSFVSLTDVSSHFQKAVIAVEDKTFYDHPGFSVRAILAALWADIWQREWRYGGSTITQQLVKNSLLTSDKNFLRKYQELILAMEIERRFTKEEILEMYANSVYFGEGAYGIENAAEVYFNKKSKDLNIAESSLLAGLPIAPSQLSPISGNREKTMERFKFVLEELAEQNQISSEEKEKALNFDFQFPEKTEAQISHAAHFALMVKNRLESEYGEEKVSRSGFKVTTTLDLDWQKHAEDEVYKQVRQLASSQVSNGAAVVMDPKSGEIRALVGSYDWYDSQFGKVNIPLTPRQPGSAFKPIIYGAGLERKLITPATVLKDLPITYMQENGSEYKPVNYDNSFRGPVLVRRALANSLNIPAVQIMEMVGVPAGLDMAKRLGITSLGEADDYGLSLVLGAGEVSLLELTTAYSVFANQGTKLDPVLYTSIVDKKGHKIFSSKSEGQRVLSSEVAFLLSSILSDNQARQEEFGNALTISHTAAVKTGTTNDYRDSWTIGYTPSLVVGVWVGNNDNSPMNKIAGSLGAAPIWKSLMEFYLKGKPKENFNVAGNINQVNICRFNGLRLRDNATSSALREYFVQGTEPTKDCILSTPTPTPTNPDISIPPPSISPTDNSNQNSPPGKNKREGGDENELDEEL